MTRSKTYSILKHGSSMFILLLLCTVLISIANSKKVKSWDTEYTPPGTIKIDSNLFIDRGEASNFFWLEYTMYLEKIFGIDSDEYKNALPNTDLWLKEDSCIHSYAEYYINHPAYYNHPVVGISHEQAEKYCDWRTNRVLEYLLIKEEVIPFYTDQNEEDYFTVDKYFSGDYHGIIPDPRFRLYPKYSLPKEDQWNYAMKVFEDRYEQFSKRKKKKIGSDNYLTDESYIVYNANVCGKESYADPMASSNYYWMERVASNMYGNVSEWLFDEKLAIGGNWKDTVSTSFNEPIIVNDANVYVGFRCICQWIYND